MAETQTDLPIGQVSILPQGARLPPFVFHRGCSCGDALNSVGIHRSKPQYEASAMTHDDVDRLLCLLWTARLCDGVETPTFDRLLAEQRPARRSDRRDWDG